jgi:hypothetical protein
MFATRSYAAAGCAGHSSTVCPPRLCKLHDQAKCVTCCLLQGQQCLRLASTQQWLLLQSRSRHSSP